MKRLVREGPLAGQRIDVAMGYGGPQNPLGGWRGYCLTRGGVDHWHYIDPETNDLIHFRSIAFDVMALWGDGAIVLMPARSSGDFVNAPLRDPQIARVYLRELERMSEPAYLEWLRDELTPNFERWRLILQREFPLEARLDPDWELIAKRETLWIPPKSFHIGKYLQS